MGVMATQMTRQRCQKPNSAAAWRPAHSPSSCPASAPVSVCAILLLLLDSRLSQPIRQSRSRFDWCKRMDHCCVVCFSLIRCRGHRCISVTLHRSGGHHQGATADAGRAGCSSHISWHVARIHEPGARRGSAWFLPGIWRHSAGLCTRPGVMCCVDPWDDHSSSGSVRWSTLSTEDPHPKTTSFLCRRLILARTRCADRLSVHVANYSVGQNAACVCRLLTLMLSSLLLCFQALVFV